MTRSARGVLGVILGLFLFSEAGASTLVEADDPRFGPRTLTIDTTSGLAWLDVSLTTGLSYSQVIADTGPGGRFQGFRYATVPEVVALYAAAGIQESGFCPESSPSLQPVLSLISMLGPTGTYNGEPGVWGLSATEPVPGAYQGLGPHLVFQTGGAGYCLDGSVCGATYYADSTSFSDLGSWLVTPVPEPSLWSLGMLLSVAGGMWSVAARHNQSCHPTPGYRLAALRSRLARPGRTQRWAPNV